MFLEKPAASLSLISQEAGSVSMTAGCDASIGFLCQEAGGGYPPEVVDNSGQFSLVGIQMEVDGNGHPTGKFRKMRPAGTTSPVGDWPDHWSDCIHEFDGLSIDAVGDNRDGEKRSMGELDALYIQHGVEHASDDVSGAWLDPVLVREGREVERAFFEGMEFYGRVPRSEQTQTGAKRIGTRST